MAINNFWPLLAALAALGSMEWLIINPAVVYGATAFLVLLSLVIAWFFAKEAKASYWWNFALLPALTQLTVIAYVIVVQEAWLLQGLAALLVIFIYIYWRFVYFYLTASSRYVSFSLENLSFYVNFLLVFLGLSSVYALKAFLNIRLAYLLPAAALFLAMVIYQSFWMSKFDWRLAWPYFLSALAIIFQVVWLLFFLPLDHHLLGLIVAVNYYLVITLTNDYLNAKLNRSRVKLYLLITGISTLFLLLTARWI